MNKVRAALRTIGRLLAPPVRVWRRSLQVRVAAITALTSAIVVVAVGIVLLDQIGSKLMEGKQRAALAEADNGLRIAYEQMGTVSSDSPDAVKQALGSVATNLAGKASNAGVFWVTIVPDSSRYGPAQHTGDIDPSTIPKALRTAVDTTGRAYQYAPITGLPSGQSSALVVGERALTAVGNFDVFYVFSLQNERQTLSVVQRTVSVAGLVLVLLVAAIAAVVTRLVVGPVRHGARIAERLAAGHLDERMRVHGTDDLARLATSFNRMAGSMAQQITELEELSVLQRRFTSDVSHELRTPVTTVRMAADVLYAERGRLPKGLARTAELLQAELDRFEGLLADLLEISRHDAGAVELLPEATDMSLVVRDSVDAVATLAASVGSEIRTRMPGTPVIAEIDPRRIARILRNLLSNAIEHGNGGPIDIVLAGDDRTVTITVRDRGAGFRPGDADRVFDRFWRADPARRRRTGGASSGLGLAISLEDARLHSGGLDAWGGRPGMGAQFRLTLPARAGIPPGDPLLPLIPADVGRPGLQSARAAPAAPRAPAEDGSAARAREVESR
ncbi:MAG: MtrAB system histidine kinase MtrB [Mycobacteriales bacterium]